MINDYLLGDLADHIYDQTIYMAYSDSSTLTADGTATSLTGEVGSRVTCVNAIVDNVTTINGIRLSTEVVASGGDRLYGVALFDAFTGGNMLQMFLTPGILHTTTFDLESEINIEVDRS